MEQGRQPGPDEVVAERARTGEFADFNDRANPENNDPHAGDKWGLERTVSAGFISRLATEPQNPPVHPKGIRIRGARIQGQLDFEGAHPLVPLILEECYIGDRIILTNASVPAIDLRGSYAADGISAEGLEVRHDLVLGGGFHSNGEVRLAGATVGGQLGCAKGTFDNPEGDALNADRIDVKGNIFLRGGFTAKGEVRLLGASVGGQLGCANGIFENPEGVTLGADGIDVKGDIFLSEGFTAKGEVQLSGASVAGQLNCGGGNFDGSENPRGNALGADRIDVKGSIFLSEGFTAKGEVGLLGASVAGQLDCATGIFENPRGVALGADGIDVKGSIFLRKGFTAKGEVRLSGASVGGRLNCGGGNFDGSQNQQGRALSADGIHVKGDIYLRDGFTAKGEVLLLGATVGGHLECSGGNFDGSETEDGYALAAQGIKASELWLGGGEVKGVMSFFDGNVGVLHVDGGFAGKEAKRDAGCELNLAGAQADTTDANRREAKDSAACELRFGSARALRVEDQNADWSGCELVLDGFVYEHIYHFPDDNVKKRLEWLRRQDPEHFFPQPYDQVVRVLRRMGYGEDARQIGIEKYKDWSKGLTLPRCIWQFFLRYLVGHGYRPQRAVVWMVVLWLVGLGLFWAGSSANLMKPALKEKVCTSKQVTFSPLLYSVDLLVPSGVMGVNFHEKSCFVPTHPDSKKSVAESTWVLWRLCEFWYYLEVFLGPILIVFLAAALGGLIDRETT